MTDEFKGEPRVFICEMPDKTLQTRLYVGNLRYEHYGLIVCDLVRHVAAAFKVDEDDVWTWVDRERHHHTTDISQPS